MLKSRLITAMILIPLVIIALFWLPPIGFNIIVLIICMLAAWEWGQFAGLMRTQQRIWLAVLFGLLLALMMLPLPPYQHDIHQPPVSLSLFTSLSWWCVALVLVLSYPKSATLWRHSRFLRLAFGGLTLIPFFWGMIALRQYHYESDHFAGAWWLLFVMLLVWGADSGAYMFGKLFGKHKLAPKVSPGKTLEGFLGGLFTSAVIAWAFSQLAPLSVDSGTLIICAIIATLASVLGDLTESMFKREAGIKDSGNLIPGHGGILDRIDSLTAAVPVFACLLLLVFHIA
ncbi:MULTISPECIES: phosphatidate cytidylyltransferase [Tatumella]|uniref:Phosphatidate cytidylyltransferase n=1 Tax=Tatumella punctata TaxID=399969 RepID=A0ABW1VRP8_9GAMM|nr:MULTISPECIES: phosphatidate cytidylyltransferase [unclassified Tatumella]MBS0856093.1 phosphatidate cytidylyltransferase [Tatumella sp. JGM16]MBS0877495.1 phosphatidate cytidylyltransferase [Tatumella sp. JGM82]MBS0890963.1 phosphatidate cytidylyltransferase [Tatumella sp. JGM94]MBS0894154.1 phosphatidate cytidylyltransferase [Tatumella sp. JGM130]MBS0901977.1 phosphatidate cytidylyltransferase [Tatumella sp. JGM100]